MTGAAWKVTFKIYRKKDGEKLHYDSFTIDVDPDEYVLDAIERIWAFHDRTLTFRHACHHSTCGACGMRVNGREKLTCITTFRSVTRDGGACIIEPLRNFPVVSDLVVDIGKAASTVASSPAFHPSRTVTCMSDWRRITMASATCASTTPTRKRKARSTRSPSRTMCAGWASSGTARCAGPRITSGSCTNSPSS